MSKSETFSLLGKPDWAVKPTDGGDFTVDAGSFELYWRSSCRPVSVIFNSEGKVTGWDEGQCVFDNPKPELFEPSKKYSCDQSDRRSLCSLK